MTTINLAIRIAPVGREIFMGVTNVGGMQIRGRSAKDEPTALRNLFYALQDEQNDDVMIAVSLVSTGQDLNSIMGELPSATTSTE